MINIYFSSTHYRKRIFLRNREWIWNIISHDLSIHIYIYMSPPREISIRSIISTGLSRFPSIPRARESVWNLVMHVSADRTRAINLKDPRKDGKDQEIRDRPSFSPRHGSTMRHFSCCRICFRCFDFRPTLSLLHLPFDSDDRKEIRWMDIVKDLFL